MSRLSYFVGNLPSRGHKGEAKYQAKQKALKKAKSWSSGKTECNMCSKTTPHTHFK